MRIEKLLLQLDAEKYKRTANIISCRFGRNQVPIDGTPEQLAACYTPERIERALSELQPDEREVLEMIAALADDHGSLLLDDAVLKSNVLFGEPGRFRSVIRSLEEQGLLFSLRDFWREKLILPEELMEPVLRSCARRLAEQIRTGAIVEYADDVSTVDSCGFAAYHDLITFLSFLAREGAEVTQKGHIYKRTINKIVEKFRSPERLFPEPFGEYMPKHFYFFESFLKRSALARFERTVWLDHSKLKEWLALSYTEWARRMYRFYLTRIYAGSRLHHRFLFRIFAEFGREANNQSGGGPGWWDPMQIYQTIAQKTERWGVWLREEQLKEMIYNPFYILGLIERRKGSQGEIYWRWTRFGLEFVTANPPHPLHSSSGWDTSFYVQPNLELMVPETVPAAVRWGVEALAEHERADAVHLYRLTRASIRRALEAGWTKEQMLNFLTRFSKVPVADNVQHTVAGWIGHFGKAELWDVLMVKVNDPELAVKLQAHPDFQRWVVLSVSETAFVIRRQDEAQFRNWMSGIGYELPLRVRDPGAETIETDGTIEGMRAQENDVGNGDADDDMKRVRLHNLGVFSPALIARIQDLSGKIPFADSLDSLKTEI